MIEALCRVDSSLQAKRCVQQGHEKRKGMRRERRKNEREREGGEGGREGGREGRWRRRRHRVKNFTHLQWMKDQLVNQDIQSNLSISNANI